MNSNELEQGRTAGMEKIDFNQEWMFKRLEDAGEGEVVSLPHDCYVPGKETGDSLGRA